MQYVLISDIHANYPALRAVDEVIQWQRRAGKNLEYWFLGDLFGYGPAQMAWECLRWLFYESKIIRLGDPDASRWVPGNHDEWMIHPNGRGHAGAQVTVDAQRRMMAVHPGEWQDFQEHYQIATDDERGSLRKEENASGMAVFFTHGSVQKTQRRIGYLYPYAAYENIVISDLNTISRETTCKTVCLVSGHTHLPVLGRRIDQDGIEYISIRYGTPINLEPGCYLINPGSVGQPRDGDPRASYAILDTEAHTIVFNRREYDIEKTCNALGQESNGSEHPQEYTSLQERLRTGYGGEHMQYYHKEVYMKREFDLVAEKKNQ